MKSILLKVSIFLSLVTIILLVLSYFEIIRYILLHCKQTKTLAENYSVKKKYSTDRKVVVVIYTDNLLKQNLKPTINSILDQSIRVDYIYIFTPKSIHNKNIPKYIEYTSIIIPSETDYNYGNSIIPSILKEKSSDVTIIPIENKIYSANYIELLLEESDKSPDSQLFDDKDTLLLFKPDNFYDSVYYHNKKDYTKKWFVDKSKSKKVLDCPNIYKCLFN